MADRDLLERVAGHARDADDLRLILDILGLRPAHVPAPPVVKPLPEIRVHGRMRAYMAGCRCAECRAKNAAERRKHRARSKADPFRADRAGHGKANTYKNHDCRCDACREAHARWQAEHLKRKQAAA
jgi:hypothetical protein